MPVAPLSNYTSARIFLHRWCSDDQGRYCLNQWVHRRGINQDRTVNDKYCKNRRYRKHTRWRQR